jgi:hypothetical protein
VVCRVLVAVGSISRLLLFGVVIAAIGHTKILGHEPSVHGAQSRDRCGIEAECVLRAYIILPGRQTRLPDELVRDAAELIG